MSNELTRADIMDGLKQIGLEAGMAVEVHSSLSSLGSVQNGPATVIQALIDVVDENGAIVFDEILTVPIQLTASRPCGRLSL